METVSINITVPKETFELARGTGNLISAIKLALKDGWQPGEDLPAILTAALEQVVPAVQGAAQIDDEIKKDPLGFIQGLGEGLRPAFLNP